MTRVPGANEETLAHLLPPIARTRGYRLYDFRGQRYLDLVLGDGRAILGHRPPRPLLEMKNLVSRGLLGDLPSPYEHRLHKALHHLLPGYPTIRIFANEERLLEALSPPGERRAEIFDPAASAERPSTEGSALIQRWRPFLPSTPPDDGPSIAVPRLPFPGSFAPAVACIHGIPDSQLPHSDLVSPALLGALVRSTFDLLAFEHRFREENWVPFDAPWWVRKGPYLIASCEKGEYSDIFRRLLEGGIVINPHYPGPSIIPAEYTEGELAPLRELVSRWKSGA